MTKQKTSEKWQSSMETFLAGELAEKAGRYLSEGATLLVHIDDKPFFYRREKRKNIFSETGDGPVDAQLWLSSNTLQHILDLAAIPGTGISTVGVAVFERVFHPDESERIRIRLEVGFWGLWQKGYFSVLKAGGPEVASYLGRLTQGGFLRLKDMLRKI